MVIFAKSVVFILHMLLVLITLASWEGAEGGGGCQLASDILVLSTLIVDLAKLITYQ